MFVKPFRTKSNVAIKGSDRKRLRAELEKTFSGSLSAEDLKELIPNKEEMTVMKLYSHKGENVTAYCLRKNPILFEHENALYPTVYTAWKYPTMMESFTTHPPVFEKLHGGADLMLPGVDIPKSGIPHVGRNQVVGVNMQGNKAPLAVGSTIMSSRDMVELAGMRGKGIKIMHTFGDHLWMLGDKEQPPTIPMDPDSFCEVPEIAKDSEDTPDYFENDGRQSEIVDNLAASQNETLAESISDPKSDDVVGDIAEVKHGEEEQREEDPRSMTDIMDELLHHCFMTALKKKLKDSELPILTSTFYRTHVIPCCPANRSLDIKKTSFKKLGKYLKHVEMDGLIQVKELTKGNDNIVAVCRAHPNLKSFEPAFLESTDDPEEPSANTVSSYGIVTQKQYEPPQISVVHCVSAVTQPLFSEMGYKKGTPMSLTQIRDRVTRYIKDRDLVKSNQPGMVTLDPLLHRAMYDRGGNDILAATWEDVFKKVISKMQACHQLQFRGLDPIIRTGGPPSIDVMVQQRASNKKVTIVSNLESFMIPSTQFAEFMRKKAQASTSITSAQGAGNKTIQRVLVQGNQVALVESLLTGQDYKIPRKYLKGLENAPKSKKKGR